MSDELRTFPEEKKTGAAGEPQLSKQAVAADADELSATRERLARVSAELDNFRKRSRREMDEQRRHAALPLLQDLLPVVDNLRHALNAADIASDPDEMLRGVRMIYDQLQDVMQRHDCQEIVAAGEPFDPDIHEAVRQVPGEPAGIVVDVVQPGYRLHDRIVRPARVVVSGAQESRQK